MATQFVDMFEEWLITEVDSAKILTYTTDFRYNLMSMLLKRGREFFRDRVYRNIDTTNNKMEDVVEFSREVYEYTTTDVTFVQVLSPAPPSSDIENFYVSANGVETRNFTFNSVTNEITINNLSGEETDIYIGVWLNGQFNQTVNLTEIGLLVRLMSLYWLRDKISTDKLVCQKVYGKDYGMHSQANHLEQLQKKYKSDKWDIDNDIMMYTYRQSPEELKNLGGEFSA